MLDFVLQAGNLGDDFLALFTLGGVFALRDGPIQIVDGLGLYTPSRDQLRSATPRTERRD